MLPPLNTPLCRLKCLCTILAPGLDCISYLSLKGQTSSVIRRITVILGGWSGVWLAVLQNALHPLHQATKSSTFCIKIFVYNVCSFKDCFVIVFNNFRMALYTKIDRNIDYVSLLNISLWVRYVPQLRLNHIIIYNKIIYSGLFNFYLRTPALMFDRSTPFTSP